MSRTPGIGVMVMAMLVLLAVTALGSSQASRHPTFTRHRSHRRMHDTGPKATPCMDTAGLREAVHTATWKETNPPAGRSPKSMVILTVCDKHCIEELFPYWMKSIRSAKGGDLARHVVLVALGMPAYQLCKQHQAEHPHQCVLDHACGYPLSGDEDDAGSASSASAAAALEQMSYRSGGYMMSLMSKLQWTRELLALNVSTLWLDMDIVVYQALLPRLVSGPLGGADFIVQEERCLFHEGDVPEYELMQPPSRPVLNGGLWVVHPTPAGKGLMDVWAGRYWWHMQREAMYPGMHEVPLDQGVMRDVVQLPVASAPAYDVRPDGVYQQRYDDNSDPVVWTRPVNKTVTYKLSQTVYQSQCAGWCGCGARSARMMEREVWEGEKLAMCWFRQDLMDTWVTMHMNCLRNVGQKVARIPHLMDVSNLGYREDRK